MADTPVRSRRPYLLRAMHEWISDSNQTPHIVVDASIEGVEVPRQYVQGGKIILNVSSNATSMLSLGNDLVRFRARFGAGHTAAAAGAAERARTDDHRRQAHQADAEGNQVVRD